MSAPASLRFSHVGLFCTDLEPLVEFYTLHMGFVITDRGHLPGAELCFLSRDPAEHHQLVLLTGRPEGLANRIVNQISFRVDSLAELKAFYLGLPLELVSDIDPVNHGISWSLYFRDPDGNRLEVFTDTDWYIHQPIKQPVDLTRDEESLRAETRAYCSTQLGFRPMADWRREIAEKIKKRLNG
jgi:catechol 2,3-dioxygenase-like lactoylglutathione lyase family enzyme